MIQVGLSLISAVLGIAVQTSGVKSTGVEIAAWLLVLLGIVLLVTGLIKLRRLRQSRATHTRAKSPSSYDLGGQLRSLGGRIVGFKRDRDVRTPHAWPENMSPLRHPLRAFQGQQAQSAAIRSHELDTLSLYNRSFAPHVQVLVDDLLTGGSVGQNEVRTLLTPQDVSAIETVGMRLIELGSIRLRSQGTM
jgi:hypothetical protein